MKIKVSLLAMLQRQMLGVSLTAVLIGGLYVLFSREPLSWDNPWLSLFVLVHSIAIAFYLGRFRSASFSYLYTRGYTRDLLWGHKMLSTIIAVLLVWLPMGLIVWTPVRSIVQDKLFISPYFPIMAGREAAVPFIWLGGYAIFLPMFHYVWIRRVQPTRGGDGSVLLAIGMVIVTWTLGSFRWHQDWFKVLVLVLAIVIIATNLAAGFLLHRKLEVQG